MKIKIVVLLMSMISIKVPFLLLWRLWFYVLITSTVIIMVPLLLVFTTKKEYYPSIWKVFRVWAKILIYGMGFSLQIKIDQKIEKNKSYLFCPNHTSLIDPFLLIFLSKNPIVFVGKKELAKIPIFGFFYKKVVIMVDRESSKSRKRVYKLAKKSIQNGTSVAIFPEGLIPVPSVTLAPFKNGAFSLAIEYQIPIVPQVYYDCKRLFSWNFLNGGPGILRIRQYQPIKTEGLKAGDLEKLKHSVFDVMATELSNDRKYMEDTNSYN